MALTWQARAAGRALAVPSQTQGLRARFNLTRAQTDAAVWVIDTLTGERYAGATAINVMWAHSGPPWTWLAALFFRLRWIAGLEHAVYAWIAAHRGALARFYSATPGCEAPQANCEDPTENQTG